MSFTTPIALVLLLALPFLWYIGWPRLAYRRSRDITSLLVRSALIVLVVLALAGTQIVRSADKLAVVFLVDVSDSIGQDVRDQQLAFIEEAMVEMRPDDEAGLVLFGGNALVDRPVSNVRELGPIRSAPQTGNTDLAEAIRLALAMFPVDTAQRIVVLSDGRVTVGDTNAAAQLAAAANVGIDYVTFSREDTPEVQVTDVRVPSTVNADQEFDLNITVDAEASTDASITVLASGEIIHQQDVELREGSNGYTLTLESGTAGFKDFEVVVDPESNDGFYQNNRLSTFSQVVGPPRVLLVAPNEEESRYIQAALEENGIAVDTTTPGQLPIGLSPLAQYTTVVMANVSAADLSVQRMETLEAFVADLGGGLVVSGGPDTYGAGGYFQTPLEDTLPVEMRIQDQQRLPQLTLVYVIDRSGSMGMIGPSGVENIELAKEAIIRSIAFLQPTDRAGIASFDARAYWVAQMQPVSNRDALQRLVGTLRASGGTDILAGMNLVAREIINEPSERKHVILLTDGGADPTGLVKLTENLFQNNDVTTSVIAIGAGAAPFLQDMADAGDGNYHIVDTVEQIPTIFTIETVLATRSYIIEETFTPRLTANHPIMDGITSSPPLLGYVATTPKQTAQVILRGPESYNDPLLAAWQYGLGRSVAFTSDATARWAQGWVEWGEFSRFWGQAVRWTITEGASDNLETQIVVDGERARLVVDARDSEGNFLNGLDLQASLVDPSLDAERLPLRQVAPGRYEADFVPDAEGSYFLRLTGSAATPDGDPIEVAQTTGWVRSYSQEYAVRNEGADIGLLEDIATLTGGRSVEGEPEVVFSHDLLSQDARVDIWHWLLLAAALLLPFDVGIRRLVITRRDLARARDAVFNRTRDAVDGPSERLTGLMSAKARAQETIEQTVASPTATVGALKKSRDTSRAERDTEAAPTPTPTPAEKPRFQPKAKPDAPAARPPDTNIAGALLKKRKQRDDEDE